MKKLLRSLTLAALFALLAACGGDSSSGSDESQASADEDVSSSSYSEDVEWSSSDENVESSESEPESSADVDASSSSLADSFNTMIDSRDGKEYRIVKIGDQTWMAENLDYADTVNMPSLKGNAWYFAYYCKRDLLVYTWAAAIDSVALANDEENPQDCGVGKGCTLPPVVQGVCPSGWHLPSDDEWETLFKAVGGSDEAGIALKSATGWYSKSGTDWNSKLEPVEYSDAYGFSVRPINRVLNHEGFAKFWTSSHSSGGFPHYVYFDYIAVNASLRDSWENDAFSVRCVQDAE